MKRYNGRGIEHLYNLGVLGPDSLLIHCTYTDNREIAILAETNTPVAHCPIAGAWSGRSVVAPVPQMLERGITVGLGTDSVATNDSLDLFQAMKFCALIHKVNLGDRSVMPAEKVLEMSTIDSAKALQLDHEIGSLESGKKADIILLDIYSPGLTPSFTPVKNIVYGVGSGNAVSSVIINGEIVMSDHEIKTIDENEIYEKNENKSREFLQSTGHLEPKSRYLKSSWKYI
jgi:5-methylthioadenosine/S-adenosylhomocysteine deaminase